MRKDILDKVTRYYKDRLAFYNGLVNEGLEKARCDENILAIEKEIKEIKLLTLQGKSSPDMDERYKVLCDDYKKMVLPYLPKIHYECDICKDKGVVGNKYCSCFMNRYTNMLKDACNLSTLPSFTFEESEIEKYNLSDDSLARYDKIYAKMEQFADNYPSVDKINIMLRGGSGTGKTCLISAIANRLISRGVIVQYITAFDLGEAMLKAHLDYKDNSLSVLTSVDVLVIDDLGSEPMRNNINQTYLQSILDSRIAHRKSTIVTTNLSAEQLMRKYGERIISRLINKTDTIAISLDELPNLRTIKKN